MKTFKLVSMMSEEDGTAKKNKDGNCCIRFTSCLFGFVRIFMVHVGLRVQREKLTSDDFELAEDSKIVDYDPKLVASYWNDRYRLRKPHKIFLQLFVKGIYAKLVPIFFLYVALYYVLNPFVFNYVLCDKTYTPTNNDNLPTPPQGKVYLALSFGAQCSKEKFNRWISMEKDFTKVLTFFIGFIVSLSAKTWFEQVRMVPKLDQILVQINNFLWVDPTKDAGDVKIKGDVTAKQLRTTIIRYFLLSWTMCLSRMCVRLDDRFHDEHALNKKKLMLKCEFDALNCKTNRDGWREKWSTPLSWVAMMVNDINLKDNPENAKSAKILDIKDAIGKTLNEYGNNLQKLNTYNEFRLPTPLISLLTCAIYVFLVINVAAGQDMYPENEPNPFVKFFFDFPWFAIVKYLMIFGWLQVATDLMAPFGKGR